MGSRIDRRLVCDALQAALLTRGNPSGLMVHSNQGVQYTSNDDRALIAKHALTQRMSRRGHCWGNRVRSHSTIGWVSPVGFVAAY